MTDFWQGFISAIALIAVSIIIAAWCSARRLERKRQQSVDAIMAKVVADSGDDGQTPLSRSLKDPRWPWNDPANRKGIH